MLALGKAALGMSVGACEACDVVGGLVVAPEGAPGISPPGLDLLRGRHPVPDQDVARRGEMLLARAAAIPESACALVLISGGGSALVDAPVEGIGPEDVADLTRRLLASGASIDEINAVRVALSRSKGGGLARALRTRRVRVLVISDVVAPGGERLVASGPMTPWRGVAPREVIARPHVAAVLRAAERARIEAFRPVGEEPAAPLEVVADNARAVAAAGDTLRATGRVVGTGPPLSGEAREAGASWARATRTAREDALVSGGETVVTVRGRGRGGRSQEVVLGALLHGIEGTLLCAGTDGIDGPTPAAGGLVDADVRARLDPARASAALDDNDAMPALEAAGGLVVTGPTGTNVADVAIWTATG